MLSFIPTPLPDETLHSIASRWFALSGFKSSEVFLHAAFPSPIEFDACDLGAVALLTSSAGPQMSGEEVVERHTLQPFFKLFLDGDVMRKFASGSSTHTARRYLSSDLRWCPSCAGEHRKREGFAAWLRAHNLPGVSVCHLHECRLQRVAKRKHGLNLVPDMVDPDCVDIVSVTEVGYAKEAHSILQNREPTASFRALHQSLKQAVRCRFPKNRRWDEGMLNAALLKSFSDCGAANFPDFSRWEVRAQTVKELRTGSPSINPSVAIHIARATHEGGLHALLGDAHARELTQNATRSARRKKKPLGPLQTKWAEQARQRAAAYRKHLKEQARPVPWGMPVVFLDPLPPVSDQIPVTAAVDPVSPVCSR